jgi:hypothetical protein
MEINTVERIVQNGQTRYGIGYKQAGGVGQQQELLLSDNGTILHSSAGLSSSSPSVASSTSSTVGSSAISSSAIGSGPLSTSGTVQSRVINYEDVPQSVRRLAESNVKNGAVRHVERQLRNGQIDYQMDFLRNDGQYQEMVISEDGRILQNQVLQGTGVGSPGSFQSGTSSSSTTTTNNASGNFLNRIGRALFDQQQ